MCHVPGELEPAMAPCARSFSVPWKWRGANAGSTEVAESFGKGGSELSLTHRG